MFSCSAHLIWLKGGDVVKKFCITLGIIPSVSTNHWLTLEELRNEQKIIWLIKFVIIRSAGCSLWRSTGCARSGKACRTSGSD
jgi:hypothetical protein